MLSVNYMPSVKKTIKSYYKSALKDYEFIDVNRKISIINLFSFVGMTITGILALSAVFNGKYILSGILASASIIYWLGYYVQKNHKTT